MAVILTVDINRLDASTQEEQLNRVPSRLYGRIKLRRVATDRKPGPGSGEDASIEAWLSYQYLPAV
jgi:hypothetical protein